MSERDRTVIATVIHVLSELERVGDVSGVSVTHLLREYGIDLGDEAMVAHCSPEDVARLRDALLDPAEE